MRSPAGASDLISAGITGWVALSVVVGADGTPQNIQVIHSLEPDLDQAAMDALARWRFRSDKRRHYRLGRSVGRSGRRWHAAEHSGDPFARARSRSGRNGCARQMALPI